MTDQPSFVQRTLKGHAAIGLLSGALMYLLILSGTLAVFDDELHRWEQPGATEMEQLAPEMVQRAIKTATFQSRATPPAQIIVHLPNSDSPRATISDSSGLHYLDRSGSVSSPVHTPWSDFVMELHFYFDLPELWGLALVGMLGVMLVALTITGVLALPRIFRDAFRFNPRASRQVAYVDWHNRLSVWTLPFAIAVAYTGAVLGMITPGAVVMSDFHLASTEDAVFSPVFGREPKRVNTAAPLANAAAALRFMSANVPDAVPTDVIVRHPCTAGQDVQVLAGEPQRLIFGEYYVFGPDGEFRGQVGLSDGRIGQQFAASMYKLHFGNFGGLPTKLAYFVFGLALTIVSGTGVSIWLNKRRRRGMGLPCAERLWSVVVWGSPLLLALTFGLRLVEASQREITFVFWAGLGVALSGISVLEVDPARLGRALRIALGAVLFVIAVAHAAMTDWTRTGIIAVDAGLALTAVLLIAASIDLRRRRNSHAQAAHQGGNSRMPAEHAI